MDNDGYAVDDVVEGRLERKVEVNNKSEARKKKRRTKVKETTRCRERVCLLYLARSIFTDKRTKFCQLTQKTPCGQSRICPLRLLWTHFFVCARVHVGSLFAQPGTLLHTARIPKRIQECCRCGPWQQSWIKRALSPTFYFTVVVRCVLAVVEEDSVCSLASVDLLSSIDLESHMKIFSRTVLSNRVTECPRRQQD